MLDALAVAFILGVIVLAGYVKIYRQDLLMPINSWWGVAAISQGVLTPGATTHAMSIKPDTADMTDKIENFFGKEDTVSSVPPPTELLAQGGPVVNGNGAVPESETFIDTHSVPALQSRTDVVVTGEEFNQATTRLIQLAADLIRQPATSGVGAMVRRDVHMQVDVARRILAQATLLLDSSQDVPTVIPPQETA